jgi:hypothetical protein
VRFVTHPSGASPFLCVYYSSKDECSGTSDFHSVGITTVEFL